MTKHDVVIIGGGPGGSMAATVLAQKGFDVAVVEMESYPRFHIGESLLPATMPLFKETRFYKVLDSGKYIRKYGARFIDYRNDDEIYFGFADGLNTEIPMAFEVPRAEFDKDLLEYARSQGATVYQPEKVIEFDVTSAGARLQTDKRLLSCEYLVDTTGRDAFLGKRMKIRNANAGLNNLAVFAHFKGVKRRPGIHEGDITIGLLPDRSWMWIIPFQGEITSVGVVASEKFQGQPELESYFNEKVLKSATVRDFMKDSRRVGEFHCIANYSHSCEQFFGDRWILAGDAAMFLDPIFSSGVHIATSSANFAAETIVAAWDGRRSLAEAGLGPAYEAHVRKGTSRFRNLIGLFYEGHFVAQMKKTLIRDNMRKGFTSAVAGDVWNDGNFLFQKKIL